ncbi:hypothetical protein M0802_001300 [Mischocyttarus mexicanus]|nr:hypothetical protein M0802_001300 [Mischocyttarus mexicanus]
MTLQIPTDVKYVKSQRIICYTQCDYIFPCYLMSCVNAIQKLKNRKTPGEDTITNEQLKYAGLCLRKGITQRCLIK